MEVFSRIKGYTNVVFYSTPLYNVRETKQKLSFDEAIHECLYYDATKYTFAGLMTLGKLRHFK